VRLCVYKHVCLDFLQPTIAVKTEWENLAYIFETDDIILTS